MPITKDTIIADILDEKPDSALIFREIGMNCLGCPAAKGETLAEACEVHNVDVEQLLTKIQSA